MTAGPRIFNRTFGSEELRFNSNVQEYTILLDNKPVLHLVDEANHFSAAAFLRNQITA